MKNAFLLFFCALCFGACIFTESSKKKLPILGERDVVNGDTIYPTVPRFSFVNQEGDSVTNADFAGKVYVVDFFFIHCPTICPRVTANMLRVYDKFKEDDRVGLIAHSIDAKNDTVAALKRHAEKLGISAPKWHLVTGVKDSIYGIADNYFSIAKEDPTSPGGFDHSGRLILVDTRRRVRSFCDGTDAKDVNRFMKDISRLLKEEFPDGK